MSFHKTLFVKTIAAIVLAATIHFEAGAWGSTGHRAIAEIAYQHLDKNAKKKIKAILGDDYLPLFATYADDIRSDRDNPLSRLPHYVNMPMDATYETAEKNERGDLVTVFGDMVAKIKDPKASAEEKTVALKFIIHLVGDAHQPMHVGLAEDLGGNKVDVTWFKKETNLHSVWDEDLIEYSKLSYTELARFVGDLDQSEIQIMKDLSMVDWIDETHEYTKLIYDNLGDKQYSYAYYYQFGPVMMKQIRTAGYRLGNFLNQLMKEV